MDTLLSLNVFCTVVQQGSFSAAARRLDISPAMATKHIAHLEQRLGARLLNRTTRKISLTEAGRLYFERCVDAIDLLAGAESAVTQAQQEPSGMLRITAPVWCANRRIAGILAQYRERYPKVTLDMHLENRRASLVEEAYDLALRATGDPSPSLIVRPLCGVPFPLVAAPAYFARRPRPTSVEALREHVAVLPSYTSMTEVDLRGPQGTVTAHLSPAMLCNDTTLAREAVLAGVGMAYLPAWLVGDDLAQHRLERVLPEYTPPLITLYAAYTSRKFMTLKVRSFIDFLTQHLAAPLPDES